MPRLQTYPRIQTRLVNWPMTESDCAKRKEIKMGSSLIRSSLHSFLSGNGWDERCELEVEVRTLPDSRIGRISTDRSQPHGDHEYFFM